MKRANKLKLGVWLERHTDCEGEFFFKVHYVEYDTEFATGKYFTSESAMLDFKKFKHIYRPGVK